MVPLEISLAVRPWWISTTAKEALEIPHRGTEGTERIREGIAREAGAKPYKANAEEKLSSAFGKARDVD